MDNRFKSYEQGDVYLDLDSLIPIDHPCRVLSSIVDNFDLSSLESSYQGGGRSSFHPRMMVKVIFYAYLNNIYSCRKIEQALHENIHFIWLSGNSHPDFRTINTFRGKRLKDHIEGLFLQLTFQMMDLGLISLKVQYIDGTKIEANANKYSFVWRKSVEKNKQKLENNIRKLLSDFIKYGDQESGDSLILTGNSHELSDINSELLVNKIDEIKKKS